jgi:hypothetical protein
VAPSERATIVRRLERVLKNRSDFREKFQGDNGYSDIWLLLQLNADVRVLADAILTALSDSEKK